MTVTQIQTRILQRLDEDSTSPAYYSPSEVLSKINEGQQLFALLTLCLEKSGTFTLTANTTFHHLLGTLKDFIVPLKIRLTSGGARLVANTLAELDALDASWQKTTGTPDRYNLTGIDLLAINKQPSGTPTLTITYAHAAAKLSTAGGVPAIPPEYHLSLVDYGIHALRVKEGGAEFLASLDYFGRFLDDALKCGDFVRNRMRAQGYDNLPFELRAFDRSRLHRPRARLPRLTPALVSAQGGLNG